MGTGTTTNNTVNQKSTANNEIINHQTSHQVINENQDLSHIVGGNRIAGSQNVFNGMNNGGYQCFGATCLQDLAYLGEDGQVHTVKKGMMGAVRGGLQNLAWLGEDGQVHSPHNMAPGMV